MLKIILILGFRSSVALRAGSEVQEFCCASRWFRSSGVLLRFALVQKFRSSVALCACSEVQEFCCASRLFRRSVALRAGSEVQRFRSSEVQEYFVPFNSDCLIFSTR